MNRFQYCGLFVPLRDTRAGYGNAVTVTGEIVPSN